MFVIATDMSHRVACVSQVYGPTAWFWEVEELLRKLILSAIVVLFDSGSPVQASDPSTDDHVMNTVSGPLASQQSRGPL